MSREIKFRFWSTVLDNFVVPDDSIFVGALKDPLFKVMQYTGLKDKNGKEIYEGDILLWQWSAGDDEINELNKGNFAVVWKYGSWQLDVPAGVPMPPRTGLWKNIDDMETENDQTFEIIGNIYENPELLK